LGISENVKVLLFNFGGQVLLLTLNLAPTDYFLLLSLIAYVSKFTKFPTENQLCCLTCYAVCLERITQALISLGAGCKMVPKGGVYTTRLAVLGTLFPVLLVCGAPAEQQLASNFIRMDRDSYMPDLIAASDCMLGIYLDYVLNEVLIYIQMVNGLSNINFLRVMSREL
jgi:hypothetical protein